MSFAANASQLHSYSSWSDQDERPKGVLHLIFVFFDSLEQNVKLQATPAIKTSKAKTLLCVIILGFTHSLLRSTRRPYDSLSPPLMTSR